MTIQRNQIITAHRNPNRHTQRGIGLLESSMREDGYVAPMTAAANGEVLDGNARRETIEQVFPNVEPIVVESDGTRPIVHVRRDIPDSEAAIARRIMYRANRIAEIDLSWDATQMLQDTAAGIDLQSLGFDSKEVDEIMRAGGIGGSDVDAEPQIDKAEELRVKWGVESGQLWQLGDHRLICGDCTKREDVERVMGGDKCDMVFTDTPYGVDYEYSEHKDSPDEYIGLMSGFLSAVPSHDLMILTCGVNSDLKYGEYWFSKKPDGILVWFDKTKQTPSKMAYLCKSEIILVFGKLYDRFAWDTLEVQQPRNDGLRELHTCPKPIELWQKILDTQKGAHIVYEPFAGSGTTIIACERLGRKCRAVEIAPGYVAVSLQRWADATGKMPVLVAS